MSRVLILIIAHIFFISNALALEEGTVSRIETNAVETVNQLDEPLYNPFVERYVLDELKQLRIELASQKVEMIQQIVDREITAVDTAVRYSTDTVTYFFYLIAGVSSALVILGWTSIREIKDRVHKLADEEINSLINEYEQRLHAIEQQLNLKTQHIEENREEIELTQDVQSLWLRSGQDSNPSNKIAIYDQILQLRKDDCEALTYKADAVLELEEPQWAVNLCNQALEIDPNNSHAFYQLACANTAMNQFDEAVRYLSEVLKLTESYREDIRHDPALNALHTYEPFKKLIETSE
jgi:tetratricopeptide (TPR) repeat protein